jgi:hypothetical protein
MSFIDGNDNNDAGDNSGVKEREEKKRVSIGSQKEQLIKGWEEPIALELA